MKKPKKSDIKKEINKRKEEIINWTKKLISFASENRPPNGFEKDAQKFLKDECKNLNLKVDLFAPKEVKGIEEHPWWLPGRNYSSGRKNVVASWEGNSNGRSLLLSGHVDVAPSNSKEWKTCNPYKPIIKEGRLYGRGSSDLKGGMAASFWALKILKEIGYEPSGDITFESVVDEEFAGGNGTLASRLKGYNKDLAILVEPTRMQVCPACIGAFLGEVILKGKAGMPYMGFDIQNPIYGAADIINLFKKWAGNWIKSNKHPLFKGKGKELKVLLWDIGSKSQGKFIQMGTPLITKLSWIVWCYPGTDEEAFKRNFENFWHNEATKNINLKPFKVENKFTYHYVRPWQTELKNKGVQKAIYSYSEFTGSEPVIGGAPFSCDMAIYGKVGGMPTIILGPRGGNLHAPDEWVEVEDILTLTGIFATLITNWTS